MDATKCKWHPVCKISDNLTVVAKSKFNYTLYSLIYKHTFNFVTPRKLLESEMFNIKYQNPKDITAVQKEIDKLKYLNERD